MLQKKTERKRLPYNEFKQYLQEEHIPQAYIGKLLNLKTAAVNQKINGTGGDFTVGEVKIICNDLKISAQKYFFPELVSISTTNSCDKEVGWRGWKKRDNVA